METKKILVIGLIIALMFFTNFTPISKIVKADDTVVLTFYITGNMTIEVSPPTYNFTQVYANSSSSTLATEFTIWNNGTVDNLTIDAIVAYGGTLTINETGPPSELDSYALLGLKGTVDSTPWYKESGYAIIDNDLVNGVPETFGLKLYAGNMTVDNSTWQTLTITYRASGA